MRKLKHWLEELDSYDNGSGYLDYDEREKLFESIMEGLMKSVNRNKNVELYGLVEELVGVYENAGYYDFGGKKEKEDIREKIRKIID